MIITTQRHWRSSALLGGSPGTVDLQPLTADFNGDGTVDTLDLARLLQNYGMTVDADRSFGDANHSGTVTLQDLLLVKKQFNSSVSAPASAAAAALVAVIDSVPNAARATRLLQHRALAVDTALKNELLKDYNQSDDLGHHRNRNAYDDTIIIRKTNLQSNARSVDTLFSLNSANVMHTSRSNYLRSSRGRKIEKVSLDTVFEK